MDDGLPFGGVVVRYRGPISDPEALPEQVIHLLRTRIPRDVQYEVDDLDPALTRRIPPPLAGSAPAGWIIRPAPATILIQDQERPPGLALAWLTYVQQVPATGQRLEQQHIALGAPRTSRWGSAPPWRGCDTGSRGSPGLTTRGRSASSRGVTEVT